MWGIFGIPKLGRIYILNYNKKMVDIISLDLLKNPWINQTIQIIIFYLIAWLFSFITRRIARWWMKLRRISDRIQKSRLERRKTLEGLWCNAINFIAYIVATLASLSLFVDFDTLVWVVGLFSAAFGLSARPIISDYLTGIGFIFEDTFAVGEKVEILEMEGVIEAINLRNTWMRSSSGELYMIPNGEIRVVRNFSRGKFSAANVSIKIAAEDFGRCLSLLEELGQEAVASLPNLLEPWQVISIDGAIGQHAELNLLAKARFGKAAEMRPRLLALVQDQLSEAGITFVS